MARGGLAGAAMAMAVFLLINVGGRGSIMSGGVSPTPQNDLVDLGGDWGDFGVGPPGRVCSGIRGER